MSGTDDHSLTDVESCGASSSTSLHFDLDLDDSDEWESNRDDQKITNNTSTIEEDASKKYSSEIDTVPIAGSSKEETDASTSQAGISMHTIAYPIDAEPIAESSKEETDASTSQAGMSTHTTAYPIADSNVKKAQYLNEIDKPAFLLKDTSLIGNPKLIRPFQLGWKREVVLQSTYNFNHTRKKANVYYCSPSGNKCCTYQEVARFLSDGLQIDNFSFKQALISESDEFEIFREANASKKINYVPKKKMAKETIIEGSSKEQTDATISQVGISMHKITYPIAKLNVKKAQYLNEIDKPAFLLKDTSLIGNPKLIRPFQLGWKREIVLRRTRNIKNIKKKANVYYCSPSGKKCSTYKDVACFLSDGLQVDNFSFRLALIWVSDEFEIFREANSGKKINYGNKKMAQKTALKGTNTRKRSFDVVKESDEVAKKRILPFRKAAKRPATQNVGSGYSINSTPVAAPVQNSEVMSDITTFGQMPRPGIKLDNIVSGKSKFKVTKKGTINVSDFKYKKPFIHGWTRKLVTTVLYTAPSGKQFNTAGEIAQYIANDKNLTSENFTFTPLPIRVSDNEKEIFGNAKP